MVQASEVDAEAIGIYDSWLRRGRHGTMQYCERYGDVRCDPRLLLPGSKWLIICAFNYYPGEILSSKLKIARYALGEDYHTVLSSRMKLMADRLTQNFGGETLIAVDTKPLRERYWAQRAGVGVIGRNNQLIVPGVGSYVLLATLLWTGNIVDYTLPPAPSSICEGCDACVRACPGYALNADGSCDTRKCISYLTIEHKGVISSGVNLRGWIYGCDVCQTVCPHNRQAPVTEIKEFTPRDELLTLDRDFIASHTGRSWQRFLGNSAMRRVPLKKLLSNL